MSRIVPRTECYKIYEKGEHIGFFKVAYTVEGRFLSVDLIKESESFMFLPKHIEHKQVMDWISDRIVPKTRIGIEDNLRQMGLSEYDELSILKYTSARHTSDSCRINFSIKVT